MATHSTITDLLPVQSQLDYALEDAISPEEQMELVLQYLKKIDDSEKDLTIPDFEEGLEWLNTKGALSLAADLAGKVVVLDFFTFCCINCMHVLPDLQELERRHPVEDGLLVVGVHSAKFPHEREAASVRSAVLRHAIGHPVVNDAHARLWQALEVSCWPTLVLLGPRGNLLFSLVGEGHRDRLCLFARASLRHYGQAGQLRPGAALQEKLCRDSTPPSALAFPGKVATDPEGRRLAVADTKHHRVLVLSSQGYVLHSVGGRVSGWRDGDVSEALFSSPQGVAFKGDVVFVADTENHLIRKIDLLEGKVSTLAGVGVQGTDKEGGGFGPQQPISSPWDLVLGTAGGPEDGVLWIAMAGTHQLWALFLEDGKLPKGRECPKGTCVRFAGSGSEENRNNAYPHKAGFAQPSGLAAGPDAPFACLFVADSESSSLRTVSTVDGAVRNLVGGERDPLNLFAFGDVDGAGVDAKLQHPLGVAWSRQKQLLYVADSYNHKIKVVDPRTKRCTVLAGRGEAAGALGPFSTAGFSEPGGLCVGADGEVLYVADTNNHQIKVLHLESGLVSLLPVSVEEDVPDTIAPIAPRKAPPLPRSAPKVEMPPLSAPPGIRITLRLQLSLPAGTRLTPEARSFWALSADGEEWLLQDQCVSGDITDMSELPSVTVLVPAVAPQATPTLVLDVWLCFCGAGGVCMMRAVSFQQPLSVAELRRCSDRPYHNAKRGPQWEPPAPYHDAKRGPQWEPPAPYHDAKRGPQWEPPAPYHDAKRGHQWEPPAPYHDAKRGPQ